MRLAVKLVVLALCIVVPLVVSSVLFTKMTERALELKIRERHLEISEHLAERTDAFFSDFEKYISTFIYNYGEPDPGSAALRDRLATLLVQNDALRILTITDAKGTVLSQAQGPWETPPGEITRHVAGIMAEKAIAESTVEYSDIYLSTADSDLFLTTATLAFPGGEYALGAELDLTRVRALLSDIRMERNETAFIIAPENTVIASTSAGETPTGELIDRVSSKAGSGVLNFLDPGGRQMVGAYNNLENGWMVFMQQPGRDAYYTAARMKNLAILAACVSLFLAVVAGTFIARSIIRPMYRLVKGAEEIGRGHMDYKVEIGSADEMGYLAGAFNRMGESLNIRDKAIARISDAARKISAMLNRDILVDEALKTLDSIARAQTISLFLSAGGHGSAAVFSHGNGGDNTPGEEVEDAARRAMQSHKEIIFRSTAGGPEDSIAIPVIFEKEVLGAAVIAGRTAEDPFTATDLQLFGIVISSVAISLENITLLKETIEKTRMEQELQTAELVQKTLFPEKAPEVPGLDLAGFIKSASETGGDWYGFVHEPENRRTAILIADVTGHGVSAALVTATTNSFFRTLEVFRANAGAVSPFGGAGYDPLSPNFMLRCLNEIIYQSTRGRLVMTLFACVYHHDTRKLVYANAGHNMPMVHRPGGLPGKKKKKETGYLVARGMRLGETTDVEFEEKEFTVQAGDSFLWFSDGITESGNWKGEEFGEKRLKELFAKTSGMDAAAVRARILEEAEAFFGDTPHADDISFIVGKATQVTQTVAAGHPRDALIVNRDAGLCRQLSLFLKTRGVDTAYVRSPGQAMEMLADTKYDLFILPIGGGEDETALAEYVKKNNQCARRLFISSGNLDRAVPLLDRHGLPLRVVRAGRETPVNIMRLAYLKFMESSPGGLLGYMESAEIRSLKVKDSHARMEGIVTVMEYFSSLGFGEHTLNTIGTIADELLSNALYNAPVDEEGNHIYLNTPRAEQVILEDGKAPVMEYGCDARFIGISVRDGFGSLSMETATRYLSKCITDRKQQYEDKPGGAGLGLFMMYRTCTHLAFDLDPGRSCNVLCLIDTHIEPGTFQSGIKSVIFHERITNR